MEDSLPREGKRDRRSMPQRDFQRQALARPWNKMSCASALHECHATNKGQTLSWIVQPLCSWSLPPPCTLQVVMMLFDWYLRFARRACFMAFNAVLVSLILPMIFPVLRVALPAREWLLRKGMSGVEDGRWRRQLAQCCTALSPTCFSSCTFNQASPQTRELYYHINSN